MNVLWCTRAQFFPVYSIKSTLMFWVFVVVFFCRISGRVQSRWWDRWFSSCRNDAVGFWATCNFLASNSTTTTRRRLGQMDGEQLSVLCFASACSPHYPLQCKYNVVLTSRWGTHMPLRIVHAYVSAALWSHLLPLALEFRTKHCSWIYRVRNQKPKPEQLNDSWHNDLSFPNDILHPLRASHPSSCAPVVTA